MDPTTKVPVYFANFVLMDYGFGAVFGCPAHDQRDFEFAKKYNLPIKTVVKPKEFKEDFKVKDEAYIEDGVMVNSTFIKGLKTPGEAISKAIEEIENRKTGKQKLILDLKIGVYLDKDMGLSQ